MREPTGIPAGDPEYHVKYRALYREKLRQQAKDYRRISTARLVSAAKARAQEKGLEFNLVKEDVVIPEVCPILGIPLFVGEGKPTSNSPSIDRFDSSKGYTKDNIWVISKRANTLKSDGTLEEFKLIVRALENGKKEGA